MERWIKHQGNWVLTSNPRIKTGRQDRDHDAKSSSVSDCIIWMCQGGSRYCKYKSTLYPREILYQLNDSGVRAIILVENFASHLQEVLGQTKIDTIILTSIGEMLGPVKGGW
jgi:hypothetical protein